LGSEQELKATLVIKMKIESASAKVRTGAPQGDEACGDLETWSGEIPLKLTAQKPIVDTKFDKIYPETKSILNFLEKNQ
jgi:hypothetical protein